LKDNDIKGLDKYTREELEQFIREKETIRQIVGQVGGKPTPASKIGHIAMIIGILGTFLGAFFLPEKFHLPAMEVGLVLLSIKIFMFLHNESKVIHFQFWMLSSLEWRLNDMSKRLINISKLMQDKTDPKNSGKQ